MQCSIATPDLAARLNGTVCLYDDIPYYVVMDDPGTKLHLHDLITKLFFKKIEAKDPKFDIATPPLGYLQVLPNRVAFAERLPHRQFRQGLTPQVLRYSYFSQQQRITLHSQYYKNTMMKVYPLLKDVLQAVLRDPSDGEYALNNDTALVKSISGIVKIYFKHEEVAFSSVSELKKKTPVIHVPPAPKSWITTRYLNQFDWEIA